MYASFRRPLEAVAKSHLHRYICPAKATAKNTAYKTAVQCIGSNIADIICHNASNLASILFSILSPDSCDSIWILLYEFSNTLGHNPFSQLSCCIVETAAYRQSLEHLAKTYHFKRCLNGRIDGTSRCSRCHIDTFITQAVISLARNRCAHYSSTSDWRTCSRSHKGRGHLAEALRHIKP